MAARIDEMTLAAFVVAVIVTAVAMAHTGVPQARERVGCNLNELVNRLMAYPRACHAPPRGSASAGLFRHAGPPEASKRGRPDGPT